MFSEILLLLKDGFIEKTKNAYCTAYGEIFINLVVTQQ